jgi:hypothetical protein
MADEKVEAVEKELAEMKSKLAHVLAKKSVKPKIVFAHVREKFTNFLEGRTVLRPLMSSWKM